MRARVGRRGYLLGAVCIAICTVMLLPLLCSVLRLGEADRRGGRLAADLPARTP